MKPAGLHLPGYDVGPALRRVRDRVMYGATRLADGEPVVVETLDVEYPSRLQIAQVERERAIAEKLQVVDGVLEVHELLHHGSGNVALITEPFAGSLAERLAERDGSPLPLPEVLDLAIWLVETLGEIHARDIVHKAISPDHLRLDRATGALRLSGFGIASELVRERQVAAMERGLEGPLAYISPEQTGRMNRDLDYRSDYYSLGVTLFELLTGQRPFEADTVLEWVHGHISRVPAAPQELRPEIPEAVGRIVLKLLAKNPEDRYQSAQGLLADLRYCAETLAAGGSMDGFEPGGQDHVQRFLLPQGLYGREQELSELLSLFEETVAGRNVFCLVHGYSGVGKSALVNELDRPLVRERGFLIQGKFDQIRRGAAYPALASAFRGLVQQVLAESDEGLQRWRETLLDALVPNADLVVNLVPELELIIGPQPPVAELPPAEARNRLQIVLINFIRVFASAEHPLVLFLDDLQWSDIPTLDLLKRLATTRELTHLMFVGAYRSNEVGPGHPLRLAIDELQAGHAMHDMALAPLERPSVARMVADALHSTVERVQPLSDLLFDKAQGNPFFTTELLKKLHAEGVITLDRVRGHWDWDLDAALWSGLSTDVVTFMVDNLRQLPRATQQVLQLAACIGGTFDLHTLAIILDRSPAETAEALAPALKQHLILPLDAEYRLVGRAEGVDEGLAAETLNPSYRFLHDRVQQAAYALIDVQRMQEVHLSVGRLMLQHASAEELDGRLIEIVDHLNAGQALITDPDERLLLARLNLRAGIRARGSTAYESALRYLKVGLDLLPEDGWSTEPELLMDMALEAQQCNYLTGRFDQADKWTEVLLKQARSDMARVEVLATRTRQYATMGRMDASIHAAIQGLALLGVPIDQDPDADALADERRQIEENLAGRPIASLVDAELVSDQATLLAMRLLMEIFPAAFLSGSGNLFPYLVLKAVNLSLRHGNCPESAFAYAAYGMLLCGELDDPALGYEYGRLGLAINERLDDIALRARVIYVYSMFVHHWSNHWSSLTPWFIKGIEAGYQSGDLLYLAYSAQDCVIWDPTLDLHTAERRHAENLEIVRECAYQDSLDSATLFLQLQRNLQGLTNASDSLSDADFDEQVCLAGMRERQFMTGIANYHIYKAEACFMHEAYDEAYAHVCEQDSLIKSAMSLPQLVRFYIVAFLTRVERFPAEDESARTETLERLRRDLTQMRRWASNCPENFLHLQYLMEGELARLAGRYKEALDQFDAAIEAARSNHFMRDEAMACERAGCLLIDLGRRRAAEGYLRAAHQIYERWGAKRKIALLEQSFPVLRELVGAADRQSTLGSDSLDLTSVMKASRAISGEMMIDRLLQTTMDILLENAGGQWGCLVVKDAAELQVEACGGQKPSVAEGIPSRALLGEAETQIALPLALISHVLATGEAVVLSDAAAVGAFTADPYINLSHPSSVLCVPIQRERFSGAIYMENNLATGVFTEDRVEVIRLLAAQAAVAIENARLYEQVQEYSRTLEERVAERTARLEQLNRELQGLADRDGLTGVANRRRGDVYLQEAWRSLQREGLPLSVIMFDVDHFKAYNDNYGHQQGDDCLIAMAQTVQAQMVRPGDLAVRYGGEEFMIILPDTDDRQAWQMAARLHDAVAELAIPHAFSSAGSVVTISAGVATAVPVPQEDPECLVREADIALYRAKKMGRNQVQRSSGPSRLSQRDPIA